MLRLGTMFGRNDKSLVIGYDFLTLPDAALGTADYLVQTLIALRRLLPEAQFVVVASRKFGRDHGETLAQLQPIRMHWVDIPESFVLRTYAQQVFSSAFWLWKGIDILHSVGYSAPIAVTAKKVLNLNRKSLRLPQAVLSPLVGACSHVFVESPLLLDEMKSRFPRLSSRVSVVPPGVSTPESLQGPFQIAGFEKVPEKFFLHVGSLEEKIRVHQMMESFAKVAHRPRFKKMGLVFLATSHDSVNSVTDLSHEFSLQDRIFVIPHQPRQQFLHLLSRCEALIYSGSALEIPPVLYQAVAFKKPVLLSMNPEDAEVLDFSPALIPFQYANSKDLAEKLTYSLSSDSAKKWLDENHKNFLGQHSWDVLAKSIVKVYEELAPRLLAKSEAMAN
jgi:glycosyltransferase involved in cell wall biosynthesis